MADIRIIPSIGAINVTGSAEFRGAGGSTLLYMTGSGGIGVGTTVPLSEFHIKGTGTRFITLDRTSTRSWDLGINSSGTLLVTDNTTSADRIAITLSGSVGIGTTQPSEQLNVVGGAKFGNSSDYIRFSVENSNAKIELVDNNQSNPPTIYGNGPYMEFHNGGSQRIRLNSNGTVQFNAYGSGTNTGTAAYSLTVDSSGNIIESTLATINGSGTANYIPKWSDSDTLSNSVMYDDGTNIGIGTTAPATKLAIQTSNAAISVGQSSYHYGTKPIGLQIAGWDSTYTNGAGIKFHRWNGTADNYYTAYFGHMYNGSEFVLAFKTDATSSLQDAQSNRMVINSSGSVGIGITAPVYQLDVNGTGLFRDHLRIVDNKQLLMGSGDMFQIGHKATFSQIATYEGNLYIDNNANDFDIVFRTDDGVGGLTNYLVLDGSTTHAYFANPGNVGIGTATPDHSLHVNGNVRVRGLTSDNSTLQVWGLGGGTGNYGGLHLIKTQDTGSDFVFQAYHAGVGYSTSSPKIYFAHYDASPTNGSVMVIDTNTKRVGIGTTSPSYKLDVNGNAKFASDVYFYNTVLDVASNFATQRGAGFKASTGKFEIASSETALELSRFSTTGAVLSIRHSGSQVSSLNTDGGAWFSGDVEVDGILTAKEFHTTFVSASIVYASGSTKFGDSQDDNHAFTGSIHTSGSVRATVNGNGNYIEFAADDIYPSIKTNGSVIRVLDRIELWGRSGARYLDVRNDAGTQNIYLSGTGNSFLASLHGNVGIGLITPTAKLHVSSSSTEIARLDSANTSGGYLTFANSDAVKGFAGFGGTLFTGLDSNNFGIRSQAGLALATGGGFTRVYITSGGSVGIGTTSPATLLHAVTSVANGQYRLETTHPSGIPNLELKGDSSATIRYISGSSNVIHSRIDLRQNGLYLLGDGATNQLIVKDTGVVQITDYGSGTNTGTQAYNLAVDSSGNIIETGIAVDGSGTANYIPKWSDSDTLTNSVIYQDANGNIGIGTTVPDSKLNVYTTTGRNFRVDQSTANVSILRNDYHLRLWAGNGYDLQFETGTSSTRRMTIAGGGNVGINTTAPSAKLNVVGSADVLIVEGSGSTSNTTIMAVDGNNGRLFEVSDDLSDSLFSVNTIAGLPVMEAFADNTVTLGAYNQYDLHITGSSVGIGASAPQAKLHVSGSTDTKIYVQNGTNTGNAGFYIVDEGGTEQYQIRYDYPNNKAYQQFNGNGLTFYSAQQSAEVARFGFGSGYLNSYFNGSVGIGTSAPLSKLHVNGSIISGVPTTLYNSQVSASGYAASFYPNPSYSQQSINMMSFQGNWLDGIAASDTHFGIGLQYENQLRGGISYDHRSSERMNIWSSYGPIMFYTPDSVNGNLDPYAGSSTPRLTIEPGGDIGIGLINPTQKLHVDGNIRVDGAYNDILIHDGADDNSWFSQIKPDGTEVGRLGFDGYSTATAYQTTFSLLTSGSDASGLTSRILVDLTGNVGLGTVSPSYKLDVNGNIRAIGGTVYYGLSGYSYISYSGTDGYYRANGKHYFEGNGIWKGVWDASGQLGIGVTTPGRLLHISGSGATIAMKIEAADGNQSSLDIKNSEGEFRLINDGGAFYIYDQTDSADRFRINTSGLVGLGNSSPTQKLTVQGSISASNNLYIDGLIYAGNIGTGTDDSVVILDSDGTLRTDEIDSRVWGTSLVDGSGAANKVAYWSDANSLTSTTNFAFDGTNLGIGNSSPGYKLDVSGTARLGGRLLRGYGAVMGTSGSAQYLGTIDTYGNGDGAGATFEIYDGHQRTWRRVEVVVQDAGGTNNLQYSVEGGGRESGITAVFAYVNRAGDATKTDFFFIPTAGKSYTQRIFAQGILIEDTGYTSAGSTEVDLDSAITVFKSVSGEVGIGTNTPGYRLDVDGDARIRESLYLGEADVASGHINAYELMTFNIDTDNDDADTRYFGWFKNGAAGSGTSLMRLLESGNLGIGVTNPSAKLQIEAADAGDTRYIQSVLPPAASYNPASYNTEERVASGFRFGWYGDYWQIGAARGGGTDIDGLIFSRGGVESLILNESGNVGIATTGPNAKLEVNVSTTGSAGDGYALRYGANQVHYWNLADQWTSRFQIGSTAGNWRWDNSGGTRMSLSTDGDATFSGQVKTEGPDGGMVMRSWQANANYGMIGTSNMTSQEYALLTDGTDTLIGGGSGGYTYIRSGNNDSNPQLVINGTNSYFDGGNVGIGSSAPAYKLDVNGNARFASDITVDGIITAKEFHTTFVSASIVFQSGSTLFGNSNDDTHTFNGSMDIIGTSEQNYLTVDGIAGFAGLSSGSGAMVKLLNSGDGNNLFIKTENSARTDASPFAVWTNNNSRFIILNNGNVGIGLTNPSGKLYVIKDGGAGITVNGGSYSSTSTTISEARSNYAFAYYLLRNGSTTGLYLTNVGTNMPAWQSADTSNNAQSMVFNPFGGNVGIGTTSPSTLLHVRKDQAAETAIEVQNNNGASADVALHLSVGDPASNDPRITFNIGNGGADWVLGVDNSASDSFKISGGTDSHKPSLGTNDRLVITSAGKVQAPQAFEASGLVMYNNVGSDSGAGVVNGFTASLQPGVVDMNTQYDYRVTLNTMGTGTINGALYIVGHNGTQWNVREVGRSGTSSNHPELTTTGNNIIIYDDHTSGYNVHYRVETFYRGQTNTTLHTFGSDYHWQRTGDILSYVDGNVGLGTTNTYARLSVKATSHNNGIAVNRQADNTAAIYIGNDGGNNPVLAANNADMLFGRDVSGTFTERMRLTNGGNLGIGTGSPQTRLHLYDGIGIFNVTDNWQQGNGGTHLFRAGYFSSSIDENATAIKIFPASNADRGVGSYWGGVSFMHLDPENSTWGTSYTGEQFWIGGRIIDTPGQERSALVFATNNNTTGGTHAAEKMVLLPNGNVGIGSTAPTRRLDVVGDAMITQLGVKSFNNSFDFYNDGTTYLNGATTIDATTTINGYVTVTGGADLTLKATNDDPGDLVFASGSGAELHRLWAGTGTLNYRTNGGTTYQMLHTGNYAATLDTRYYTETEADNRFVNVTGDTMSGTLNISKANVVYPHVSASTSQLTLTGNNQWIEFGTPDIGNERTAWILARHNGLPTYGGYYSTLNIQPRVNGTIADYEGVAIGYGPDFKFSSTVDLAVAGLVGIGNTNPSYKLHVLDSTANGRAVQGIQSATSGTNYGAVFAAEGSGATKNVGLYANATGATTNYAAIFDNGTVGIGTTAPKAKLHLRKDATAVDYDNFIMISNKNSGATEHIIGGLLFDTYRDVRDPAVVAGIWGYRKNYAGGASSAGELIFATSEGNPGNLANDSVLGPTERMRINQFGNVGIGTDTPAVKLDVRGTGGSAVGYSDVIANFKRTQANQNSYIAIDNTTAGYDSGIRFAEAGTAKWTLLNYRSSSPDGFAFYNHTGSNIPFFIGDSGNVGINTTNPAYTLEVNGTAQADTLYIGGNLPIEAGINIGTGQDITFMHSTYGNDYKTRFENVDAGGGKGYVSWQVWSNTYNSYQDALTILATDAAGTHKNVGIGTTSPSTNLDVVGNIKSSNVIYWNGTTGALSWDTGLVTMETNTATDIALKTNGAEAIRIKNGGNVGIGSTAPEAKLNVVGSADVLIVEGSGSTANTTIMAVDGNNGRLFEVSDDLSDSLFSVNTIAGLPVMEAFADNTVILGAYNQCDLVVTGSRVGIGTCSPSEKLHVRKTNLADNTAATLLLLDGQFQDSSIEEADMVSIGFRVENSSGGSQTSQAISFAYNNYLSLMKDGGNVGIGSTAPQYKLDVVGTFSADSINVNNAFTFPTADGSSGQALITNGSGTVSWGSPTAGSAARVNTVLTNTNASYYLTFVDSNNASATAEDLYTSNGLYVNPASDSIYATGNIISYASSDKRLKDNLTPIKNATEKIAKIHGYEFDWNDKQVDFEGHDIGVVAQEIEEVLPEVVTERADGYKAVKYEKIVALLIQGMKEQQAEIEQLKQRINELEK